jgi:hypothetical protein
VGRRAGSGLVGKDGEDDIERVIVVGDGLCAAASKTAKIALYPQGYPRGGCSVKSEVSGHEVIAWADRDLERRAEFATAIAAAPWGGRPWAGGL